MDALFPPGPQKSLLLGDAPLLQHNPLSYLLQASRTYGDIVHFRVGPSHAYLLTNPRDAHDVLVERFDQFSEKPSLFRALNSAMGHDLFAPKETVKQAPMRRGVFQTGWLDPLLEAAAQSATQPLDSWRGGDPLPMLRNLTLSIVVQTLFGDSSDRVMALTEQLDELVAAQQDYQRLESPFTPPGWIPTVRNRQRQHAAAELKRIMRILVEDHRARGRYDLLWCLLQAADIERFAIEEALALFHAGHRAAAHTLAWAWALLAQHPDAAEALHTEVETVLGSRTPTADDLANLPYCDMIIRETLRLHPPMWLISRQAKRETRLRDYYVPAGSTILISPYIVHHSARYFTSPEHFLPERFSDSLTRRGSGYAYMPFGAGRYAQVEHDYALTIGKLILAMSAQRFRLGLVTTGDESEVSAHPRGLQLQAERFEVAV